MIRVSEQRDAESSFSDSAHVKRHRKRHSPQKLIEEVEWSNRRHIPPVKDDDSTRLVPPNHHHRYSMPHCHSKTRCLPQLAQQEQFPIKELFQRDGIIRVDHEFFA